MLWETGAGINRAYIYYNNSFVSLASFFQILICLGTSNDAVGIMAKTRFFQVLVGDIMYPDIWILSCEFPDPDINHYPLVQLSDVVDQFRWKFSL